MATPPGGGAGSNSLIFRLIISAQDQVTNVLGSIRGGVLAWIASLTASFAALSEFINVNKQVESAVIALNTLTGSQEETNKAIAALTETADTAGMSLLTLTRQYTSFAAAAKGTALEGELGLSVFQSVASAMGTLGRSTEDTDRAFAALSQMMAKGQVYAEEWRGQLGEALPVANAAIQKATGLTIKEFNAMMEAGNLLAQDTIPALALGLEMLGLTATERVDSISASLGRMENAFTRAYTTIGDEGGTSALKSTLDVLTTGINGVTAGAVALGKNIGATFAYLAGAIPSWEEYSNAIKENNAEGQRYIDQQAEIDKSTSETADTLKRLAAASLKAASDYTRVSDAAKQGIDLAEKQVEATEANNKANLLLAKTTGDVRREMDAEIQAANDAAEAMDKRAEKSDRLSKTIVDRIAKLKDEIVAQQAVKAADEENAAAIQKTIEGKQIEIGRLQESLDKQKLLADQSRANAEEQRRAAEIAKLAAETYGDQADSLGRLSAAHEEAKASIATLEEQDAKYQANAKALAEVQQEITDLLEKRVATSAAGQARLKGLEEQERKLTEAMAAGKDVSEDINKAREAEALAAGRVKDALADLVARRERELAAAERLTGALEEEGDLRVQHLRNLAQEAEARGDVGEAAEYERDAQSALIEAKEDMLGAYEAELAQLVLLAEAKRDEANADKETTSDEKEAIVQADAAVAAKQRQIAALQEMIRNLQALQGAQGGTTQTTQDYTGASQGAADATGEVTTKISGAAEMMKHMRKEIEQAISSIREYSDSAADAVQSIIDSYDSWYGKIARIRELASNFSLFDTGEIAESRRELASLGEAMESVEKEIGALQDKITSADSFLDWVPWYKGIQAMKEVEKAAIAAAIAQERMTLRQAEMTEALDELKRKLDDQTITIAEYEREVERLQARYKSLGEEKLEDLRDALQDAKDKTDDLRESAQSALEAALDAAEAAGLGSTALEREEIKHKQTMADLEEQLADARAAGDAQAIRDLERAIALQKKAHEARMQQLRDELAAEEAVTQEQAKRDETPTTRSPGRTIPDVTDTPDTAGTTDGGMQALAGAFAGAVGKAMDGAIQTQTRQWEDATNRMFGALDKAIQVQTQTLAAATAAAERAAAAALARPVVLEADGQALARLVAQQSNALAARRA